jgi:hypothetical protein
VLGLTAQDVLTVVIASATASVLVGAVVVGVVIAGSRAVAATVRYVYRVTGASLRR